jgi:DNA-binding NarL/FixJ family response regulator
VAVGRGNSRAQVPLKSHIGHVFTKLGLRDQAAAIVCAFDHRVVEPR